MENIYIAFDIDNTLIFKDNGNFDDSIEKIPISTNAEGVKSYCTLRSFNLIKEIRKFENVIMIPVTARTEHKFRSTLLYSDVNLKHFIVNVGQRIFLNDVEDTEWKSIVDNKVAQIGKYYDYIYTTAIKILGEYIKFERYYENFCSVRFNNVHSEKLDLFDKELGNKKLSVIHSENKINILLEGVSKSTALEHMLNNYFRVSNKDILIACGDDYLDYSMLKLADISLVPKGSRLQKSYSNNFITTKNEKLLAGEEILEYIYSFICKWK